MNWSLRLGKLAGIPVFVHWTFTLLLIFVWWHYSAQGKGGYEIFLGLALVILIFACVTLHELGHALAARRYGIQTSSITLLPIGGVAQLEKMPKEPKQELVVALAGPAVNVVIALIMVPIVMFVGVAASKGWVDIMRPTALNLPLQLLWINVILVVFNLIPAFPMDGGRVLRAILASRMEYAQATRIAARVGQAAAIVFVIAGLLWPNFFLLFIALFVFLGAEGEAQYVERSSALDQVLSKHAVQKRFRLLNDTDTMAHAASQLLAGSQKDFPVVDISGQIVGILTRDDLVRGVTFGGYDSLVRDFMHPDWLHVDPDEPLEDTYREMAQRNIAMAPILRDGKVVGMITTENIQEYMMLSSAVRTNKAKMATAQG